MKTDLFLSCGYCWVVQICWHIECSTFTASSFRIWNRSTGIPPPLALFVVMLPKAHLTLHSRCTALGEWSHHCDYLGLEDLFCLILLFILARENQLIPVMVFLHSTHEIKIHLLNIHSVNEKYLTLLWILCKAHIRSSTLKIKLLLLVVQRYKY